MRFFIPFWRLTASALGFFAIGHITAQTPSETAPPQVARTQVAYPIPYEPATTEQITAVLNRVRDYLETANPIRVLDQDGKAVSDLSHLPERATLGRGDFLIISYEWGVTYSGMLLAAESTSDLRFKDFVHRRMDAIRLLVENYKLHPQPNPPARFPLRSVISPAALDDCGSMSAAMIKSLQAGAGGNLRPLIDNYLTYIKSGQMRFADGTLARNRPLPNSLWLDDLYMSVPALAQMGKLTGDASYFDDAVKQIIQFSERMFVKEKGLYMHGWVESMPDHPAFFWARPDGWALMAMTELLSVLPETHPGYQKVLTQYRQLARGLAPLQGKSGLWHQLLDHNDTYEETSASAIFVYCLARGINRGWLDPLAYGPVASLGWNAVATKVNEKGQVEGTCIGTGMGWDPMFYAFRPTSVLAAHGYGPVLLAGAEMISLRRGKGAETVISDGALQFGRAGAAR